MADPVMRHTFGLGFLLTALVAFGAVSTDLYLPSLPDMTEVFDTSVSRVQLTLSVFLGGFAFAQLLFGPLADRFGRRPVLLVGLSLYVAAAFACLFVSSIEALIIARFFQGLGGGAGTVVGRAVVRDVYGKDGSARMFAYTSSAMALAPMVAPIIGGWLHMAYGWRANFIVLVMFGLSVLVSARVMLVETNPHANQPPLNLSQILRNYGSLLSHRTFIGYGLCAAFSFAGLFAFISGSSFTLIDVLGLTPENFGFGFAVVVLGYVIGAFTSGRISHRFDAETMVRVGVSLGLVAGVLAAGLAWAGVQTLGAVILPISLYCAGCGFGMPNGMAGAVGPFPHMAGAAAALVGFLQLAFGGTAGFAVGLLFDGTTRAMPSVIAICAVLAFITYLLLVRQPHTRI